MDYSISYIYTYRHEQRTRVISLQTLVEMMQRDTMRRRTDSLRRAIVERLVMGSSSPVEEAAGLPAACFSRSNGRLTPLVLLSFPSGGDQSRGAHLIRKARQLPQTLMTFTGVSGRSVKVVVAFAPTEHMASENVETANTLLDSAFCRVAMFYSAALGAEPASHESGAEMICRIGYAPDVWLNDHAVAMPLLDEPQTAADVSTARQEVKTIEPLRGYTSAEIQVSQFNYLFRQISYERRKDDATFLLDLAGRCRRKGVDRELAVKSALSLPFFQDKEFLVRTSFESAYNHHPLGVECQLDRKVIQQLMLEDFLRNRYQFRRNTVSGGVEYREVNRYLLTWRPLDTKTLNTITRQALRSGISVWDKDIKRYVESNDVQEYDPISDYLNDLPQWDGIDRVAPLARRVPVADERWSVYFAIWMRSMVSQWMGGHRLYGSSMVLMLTGAQGTGKSTFMRLLLPPELSPYYLDRLDFTTKKEAERALMRFALINIDEFDQISASQTAFLKHLLQKSSVTQRKMYEDVYTQRRRYATFAATTNSPQPLVDATGSRRYLCEEVQGTVDVDMKGDKAIDYPQLYAQLVAEVRAGEPSYFDMELERAIQQHNQRFTEQDPLNDIFHRMYTFPTAGTGNKLLLSSMEILQSMHKEYSGIAANHSNAVKLGKLLQSCHFKQVSVHSRFVYEVARR